MFTNTEGVLSVTGLRLNLFVGCLAEEKLCRQPVDIDFSFFFPAAPKGCASDKLDETICYARCIAVIREMTQKRHFYLLEHLGFEIHTALSDVVPEDVCIQVRVTKPHPPLPEVNGGVSFTYCPREFPHA